MTETIVVPELFQGYPGVAFGGYTAGVLAGRSEGTAVRVDFRGPVPVGTPVWLTRTPEGGAELTGSDQLRLALATPGELSLDVPDAPGWEESVAAAEAFRADPPSGTVDCFGCGLDRTPDRGLRQHCARIPGRDVVAAAWIPDTALAGADGLLPPEIVWGALDCPGAWAARQLGTSRPGQMTAALTGTLLRPVVAGEGHVSYSWLLSESGRKHRVGVALATAEGEVCGVSEALWVDPR